MVVGTVDSVVGVRSIGAEDDWADSAFLDSVVGESFTVGMLRKPDGGRHAVVKANHGVLPVTNVVVKVGIEEVTAPVESARISVVQGLVKRQVSYA